MVLIGSAYVISLLKLVATMPKNAILFYTSGNSFQKISPTETSFKPVYFVVNIILFHYQTRNCKQVATI